MILNDKDQKALDAIFPKQNFTKVELVLIHKLRREMICTTPALMYQWEKFIGDTPSRYLVAAKLRGLNVKLGRFGFYIERMSKRGRGNMGEWTLNRVK